MQSVHGPPPVPQVVSALFWQVLVLSQQPVAQLVGSQDAPPLLDVLEPELDVEVPPPSSPLPLLLVVLPPYPLDDPPVELDEPELVPPPVEPPLVLKPPEDAALRNFPSSAGSGADVAHATAATAPMASRMFAGLPR